MSRVAFSCVAILLTLAGMTFSLSHALSHEMTPVPTTAEVNTTGWIGAFPFYLRCDQQTEFGMGGTWQGITIGVSSVDNLLEVVGADEVQTHNDYAAHYSIQTESYIISICAQDDVITALSVTGLSLAEQYKLSDLVIDYGLPDALSVGTASDRKFLYWFEHGFAVQAEIGTFGSTIDISLPHHGTIGTVVLFPAQTAEGYKTRWPYRWAYLNPDLMPDDDPFRFDDFVATITAQPSRTPTPTFTPWPTQTATPTTNPIGEIRGFPLFLGCSYIETVAEGPSWENITVGQTTFEELDALFHELNPNYVQSGNIEPRSYQWILDTKRAPEQAPNAVQVCIVDGIVAALRLSPPILSVGKLYLQDFLALYGHPDVITWGTIDISDRVAFWFEEGVAVNFSIGEAFFNEDVVGTIVSVTYFPYQEVEGYENRWPFNRTKERPFPNVRGLTPQPLNLMGTITALEMAPSHTPTPTFTPWPTQTATPTSEPMLEYFEERGE